MGPPRRAGQGIGAGSSGRARAGAPRAPPAPLTPCRGCQSINPVQQPCPNQSRLAGDGHGLQRQEPGAAPGGFLQPESLCAAGAAPGAGHSHRDSSCHTGGSAQGHGRLQGSCTELGNTTGCWQRALTSPRKYPPRIHQGSAVVQLQQGKERRTEGPSTLQNTEAGFKHERNNFIYPACSENVEFHLLLPWRCCWR